jgi:DNA-binding protein H-NS
MDLSTLTVAQLRDLQQQIPAELKRREQQEKQNILNEVRAFAKARGFALEELVGKDAPKAKAAGGKVKVKYRHPKDASLEWTGRGRQPRWVVDWLAGGGKIEGLAV